MASPTFSTPALELRGILAELKIAVELFELCIRLQEQGGPSPGVLREAMERLERIPPRIYNLLHQPRLGGDGH